MKQFKLDRFIEPSSKYKIVVPFKICVLRMQYTHKYGYYTSSSIHLNLRKNYSVLGASWSSSKIPVWCHNHYLIPTADLTKIAQHFSVTIQADSIVMPANMIVRTNKKPYQTGGIRFQTNVKDNLALPFKKGSFIVPWAELKNLVFEEA
jgi:hypothetical protein